MWAQTQVAIMAAKNNCEYFNHRAFSQLHTQPFIRVKYQRHVYFELCSKHPSKNSETYPSRHPTLVAPSACIRTFAPFPSSSLGQSGRRGRRQTQGRPGGRGQGREGGQAQAGAGGQAEGGCGCRGRQGRGVCSLRVCVSDER